MPPRAMKSPRMAAESSRKMMKMAGALDSRRALKIPRLLKVTLSCRKAMRQE